MSYRTVEVDLENGRVQSRDAEPLPPKAHALLTILDAPEKQPNASNEPGIPGLRRFLSRPPLKLTNEQFRASMEADFWEQ